MTDYVCVLFYFDSGHSRRKRSVCARFSRCANSVNPCNSPRTNHRHSYTPLLSPSFTSLCVADCPLLCLAGRGCVCVCGGGRSETGRSGIAQKVVSADVPRRGGSFSSSQAGDSPQVAPADAPAEESKYTPGQVAKFKLLLRNGAQFLKHGRAGRPHKRYRRRFRACRKGWRGARRLCLPRQPRN